MFGVEMHRGPDSSKTLLPATHPAPTPVLWKGKGENVLGRSVGHPLTGQEARAAAVSPLPKSLPPSTDVCQGSCGEGVAALPLAPPPRYRGQEGLLCPGGRAGSGVPASVPPFLPRAFYANHERKHTFSMKAFFP